MRGWELPTRSREHLARNRGGCLARTRGGCLGRHHSYGDTWDGKQWVSFDVELVIDECDELHGRGWVVGE